MGSGLRVLLWYCGVGCLELEQRLEEPVVVQELRSIHTPFHHPPHLYQGHRHRNHPLPRRHKTSLRTRFLGQKIPLSQHHRNAPRPNRYKHPLSHFDRVRVSSSSTWPTTFFLQSSGFRLGASIGLLECAVAPDDREMLVIT